MGYLEQIYEQSAALGGEVDKALDPAREWLARADELSQEVASLRAAEEARHARLVKAIASGASKPSEAAKAAGTWAFDSPASLVLVQASRACHANADAAARRAGPELFAAMQRRVIGVVEESARLAATVPPGVVDEPTALRASNGDARHFKTWQRLRALVDDWTACFDLLATLQRAGAVDGPAHPRDRDGAVVFQRYLRPLSLPPGYWKGPGELRLAKAAASNAAPGMYPWSDAVERWQRIDRRQRDYRSMTVVQTHDSMGNVIAEQRGPETAGEFAPAVS